MRLILRDGKIPREANKPCDQQNSQRLSAECPGQLTEVNEGIKDGQAQGGVHCGGTIELRIPEGPLLEKCSHVRHGACLLILVGSKHQGSDQLRSVGAEWRDDEGDVESSDVEFFSEKGNDIYHGIGENGDQEGSGNHLSETFGQSNAPGLFGLLLCLFYLICLSIHLSVRTYILNFNIDASSW